MKLTLKVMINEAVLETIGNILLEKVDVLSQS